MPRKVFVRVLAETDEQGNISPKCITWEDGRAYTIDKVTDIRRSFAEKVGGTAIRYTVNMIHTLLSTNHLPSSQKR